MGLQNDVPRIREALDGIGGVKQITDGWPKNFEHLPCIAISESGNLPALDYDDGIYADELIYDLRVFAVKKEDKATVAAAVDQRMSALRYRRVLVYDDDGADVRMKMMRYKTVKKQEG